MLNGVRSLANSRSGEVLERAANLVFVTVTLDKVFDVVRYKGFGGKVRTPPFTNFSFESAGKRHFAVPVLGWPSLDPGARITVALKKPGNWQTLVSWINHDTGEIIVPDTGREEAIMLLTPIVSVLSGILFFFVEYPVWHFITGLFAVGLCVHGTFAFHRWRFKRVVIRRTHDMADGILKTGLVRPS